MRKTAIDTLDGYLPMLVDIVHVVILIALGYLVTIIISRLIRTVRAYSVRVMLSRGGLLDSEVEKRATTVASVLRRTLLTLLWVAIAITSLQELGFKINALLAGAGVSAGIIGGAIGFGAQSLIKDVISGLFMLVENQIRVGDVAVINTIGGAVEEINLRTTILRSENGAVHVIPNGSIQTLANLTRDYSFYVFELSIQHNQDPARVMDMLRAIASEVRADPSFAPFILDDLDLSGVDRLTQSAVVIKARIKTLPTKQWVVGREMNRLIRERFVANGIELTAPATEVRLEKPATQELKTLIREVLREEHRSRE